MTRFASRWQSRLAWLGLFSMWLALAGPILSQTQRLLSVSSDGGQHTQPLPGTGHAMLHHGHGGAPQTEEHLPAVGYDLAGCGYCLLFLHMPGITPSGGVVAAHAIEPRPVLAPDVPEFFNRQHPRFLPRAPPGIA